MSKNRVKTLVSFISLGLAVVSSIGGTFAWFAMNNSVFAEGMTVVCKAEAGLAIADSVTKVYGVTATASNNSVYALMPTSTADCVNWTHSGSTSPTVQNAGVNYTDLTAAEIAGNDYIAKYSFYVRSSGAETLSVASMDVYGVALTSSVDQNLTKSIRIGIVFGGKTYIYAPVDGYTETYKYKGAGDNVTVYSRSTPCQNADVTEITGNTTDGILVKIYVWFEGEDANCVSDNIVTNLGSNEVQVAFTYTPETSGGK